MRENKEREVRLSFFTAAYLCVGKKTSSKSLIKCPLKTSFYSILRFVMQRAIESHTT